ncbi:hypothetical protein A35E_00468 [secondary endosymbiont of Heteropsylla cubana]|uniref:UPF0250 protein A35E_00468 n=1 Tax=secondary endosymbiont of Heteropsylla cubana TaxID=134287 RepID=J3TZ63_9ENTR|nr:DUF493 family protein YbeD [secondary endosymbiont of Heteropsylla cubana]AFP85760.1 hypothetical protein A35E_00468 [secondary endosymbiont of Heteropsylla cubana]
MKTQLKELLEFPCLFTYKVIGFATPKLLIQVLKVIEFYTPGNYLSLIKKSKKGNYHSISITIRATDINQIETLYDELSAIEIVRVVL